MNLHVIMLTGEIDRDAKMALFKAGDVYIDCQIKDGLDVGPFEFLACHSHDKRAPLIISEFAGCSKVLAGAISINPWNTAQIIAACDRCCRMANSEKEHRYLQDYRYCKDQNLFRWAEEFLSDLRAARKKDDMKFFFKLPSKPSALL